MVKKIINIIKGTFYNLFNKKQDLADKRLMICKKCNDKTKTKFGAVCKHCGCILESKTRVKDEHCDINKW